MFTDQGHATTGGNVLVLPLMSDASPDQDPDPENEKGAEGTGPDHIATAGGIVAVQGTKAGTGVQSISKT